MSANGWVFDEWMGKAFEKALWDETCRIFGVSPDDIKNERESRSQYESHSKVTALPEDPQERWLQHLDRMRRGKRLTGDGREINEERP